MQGLRSAALSLRMMLTGGLPGTLSVGPAVVLFPVLSVGRVPLLVIVLGLGLAFFPCHSPDTLSLIHRARR